MILFKCENVSVAENNNAYYDIYMLSNSCKPGSSRVAINRRYNEVFTVPNRAPSPSEDSLGTTGPSFEGGGEGGEVAGLVEGGGGEGEAEKEGGGEGTGGRREGGSGAGGRGGGGGGGGDGEGTYSRDGGGGGLSGPPMTLEALPAGAANAVVMSLVLSYVPTPRQRGEMIRRARELLADDGRGLLLLVTPHSTDKGHVPHKALPILKEWRTAIEAVGFERYRYERLRSVHAMAYRTVGTGGAKVRAGMAPPMRIAFDGPDADMSLPTDPDPPTQATETEAR